MRRIVVTGMGAVSPLGCGVETNWSRLTAGKSGIRRLPEAACADLPCKVAGLVPDTTEDPEAGFDPSCAAPVKDQKKMDRFILFALLAAEEAVAQANWHPAEEKDRTRTATIIGSGVGGFPAIADSVRLADSRGVRRLSPFTVPSFLVNLAAGQVSIKHGFKGALGAPVTACAAGVQAIGDAARIIRAGEADIALAGGAEACVERTALGGFAAARALSSGFNDTPERASRPFDKARDGFVMGEGAGLLVIEELEHALARGAKPIAELIGYGTSADAYHMTSGPEDGDGARRIIADHARLLLNLRQRGEVDTAHGLRMVARRLQHACRIVEQNTLEEADRAGILQAEDDGDIRAVQRVAQLAPFDRGRQIAIGQDRMQALPFLMPIGL